jgi:hypothetical protein
VELEQKLIVDAKLPLTDATYPLVPQTISEKMIPDPTKNKFPQEAQDSAHTWVKLAPINLTSLLPLAKLIDLKPTSPEYDGKRSLPPSRRHQTSAF